jgi:uncharacterized membrane protein YdjX (TVP38/TMEM64 family)
MRPLQRLRSVTARQWRILVLGLIVATGWAFLSSRIDMAAWRERAVGMNGIAVFALIVVLPLLGFPVSVLHVIAGLRFGAKLGLMLVVISIGLQLAASYGLVHLWRARFARRFSALRARLPSGAHGPVCLFTMLLPGVPYFAKNYVLPLAGIPLGPYLAWCWPLHAARATIGVVFGDQSDRLTPWKIAGFGAYALVIVLSCAWAFRRLKGLAANPPPAEGGPKPVA